LIGKEMPRKKRGLSRREIKISAYTIVGVLSLVGAVISYLRQETVSAVILSIIGITIIVMGALD